MSILNRSHLAGALGVFMLVASVNTAISQETDLSQDTTLAQDPSETIDIASRVDNIFAFEDWSDRERAFYELKREINGDEELTRQTIRELAQWLKNDEHMKQAAHQISAIANWDSMVYEGRDENWQEIAEQSNAHLFAEELTQPLIDYIANTKGTTGELAEERIYIARVLAHTSPELVQLEIDHIPALLDNADLTTLNEVISSYYIINRNFPGQFEAAVADALEQPLEEFIPYLSHENPNVRYNVADLVGDIGAASQVHALQAAQALAPLINDPNEDIREEAISILSNLCDEPKSAEFILDTLEPLIPTINEMSRDEAYFFLWAIEFSGLENPQELGDRAIYLLQLTSAHMSGDDAYYNRQRIAEDVLRISEKQLELQQEDINRAVENQAAAPILEQDLAPQP